MPAPVPTLASVASEYRVLFTGVTLGGGHVAQIDVIVDKIVANRPRYEKVQAAIGAPWFVVAVIHSLEASLSFAGHLHNGDPLTARTTHVPAGRPTAGRPPFTWEESAEDALRGHNFDTWGDWSISGVLFKLEQYNGWGYRRLHSDVLSPYLWSFTSHYTKGKFVADGQFDRNAVSKQCGAAALLARMIDRGVVPRGLGTPVGPSHVEPPGPVFRFGPGVVHAHGVQLQRLLNDGGAGVLVEDGMLGAKSSDAVKRAFGVLLAGDSAARPQPNVEPSGPLFRFAPGVVHPHGVQLQRLLNDSGAGVLVEDGMLGAKSSDAVKRAIGVLLAADPRL